MSSLGKERTEDTRSVAPLNKQRARQAFEEDFARSLVTNSNQNKKTDYAQPEVRKDIHPIYCFNITITYNNNNITMSDIMLQYNNRVDVRGHKYVFGPTQLTIITCR